MHKLCSLYTWLEFKVKKLEGNKDLIGINWSYQSTKSPILIIVYPHLFIKLARPPDLPRVVHVLSHPLQNGISQPLFDDIDGEEDDKGVGEQQ